MSTNATPPTRAINLAELVGLPFCVSQDDGNAVFEVLHDSFVHNQVIELSFLGVETVISAFLNAAIGQLYGRFPKDFINSHLIYKDTTQEIEAILDHVVSGAIDFFSARPITDDSERGSDQVD